jgi:hypothetical protein
MPSCVKCGNAFPNTTIIDGVHKILNSRKYCLNCSPFGKHNTRKLEISVEKKKCPRCQNIKHIHEFYARRDRPDPSAYCITCSGEQCLERIRETKLKCVEYKGGKCVCCGYDKHICALDFHHKNRSDKKFEISAKLRWKFERLKPELDKCILVCSRCHREIEAGVTECPAV